MRTIEGFHHTMLTDRNVTPTIADGYEFEGLQYIYGPEDGRVFLTLKSGKADRVIRSDDWTVIDTMEAGRVEIRRADCGSGCKCAAEIRPVGATPPKYICSTCKGENVLQDAYVALNDPEDIRLFDEMYCEDCEGPTTVEVKS
jgi:hypothetical protein